MTWLFSILIVLTLGGVAAVAVGRGDPLAQEYVDDPDTLVPAIGPVNARDLRAVRFPIVFRGYRMSEVDALLDRLTEQIGDPPPAVQAQEAASPPAAADDAEAEVVTDPGIAGPEPRA